METNPCQLLREQQPTRQLRPAGYSGFGGCYRCPAIPNRYHLVLLVRRFGIALETPCILVTSHSRNMSLRTPRLALHLIGPGELLQSLSIRKMVAACNFLYKLLYTDLASRLHQVLTPSQAPRLAQVHPTRRSLSRLDMHSYQFETSLPIHCRESCRRSFSSCAVSDWNALPSAVLNHPLTSKGCKLSKWLSSGISVLSVGTGPRASCNLA